MSMNLIAMLVSLAMMLTGAGGAVQTEALPVAQTARTLTLSNVSVTWNGETTQLEPQVHMGVSTDGQKAVYDFAVDLGDKKLFPVQVSAGENGLTALSGNSGVAVNVTAGALAGLAEQLEAHMNASLAENGGGNARLMQFITDQVGDGPREAGGDQHIGPGGVRPRGGPGRGHRGQAGGGQPAI